MSAAIADASSSAYGAFFRFLLDGMPLWTLIAGVATAVIYYRQLKTMAKARQLEADVSVFAEANRLLNIRRERELYCRFCDDGFSLKLAGMGEPLRCYIVTVVEALNRVGALVRSGYVTPESPSIYSLGDRALRMWLVLEEYVKRGREKRGDPHWSIDMEYLTVLALRHRLGRPETGHLKIYHPDSASPAFKEYSRHELLEKLGELEAEIKKMRYC